MSATPPQCALPRPAWPQSWNRYSYVLNNPLRLVDPSGLSDKPTDGQQPQGPQPQPPPAPQIGAVTITPEEVRLRFETTCNGPATDVPLSPEANALLVNQTARMTSNIVNFLIAAYNLELSPVSTEQRAETTSAGLTLQIGTGPTGPTAGASATASNASTVTLTSQTPGPLAAATRSANDVIQGQLGQALAPMQSPVACSAQPVKLGEGMTGGGTPYSAAFPDLARKKANELAVEWYTKTYSRSLPKAYDHSSFFDIRRF